MRVSVSNRNLMHEQEPLRTDQRLDPSQQQAVLMLASRLQQEQDESATLADLIRIGEEAGLSRETIEAAFQQVVSQPTERALRKQLETAIGNELGAIHVTFVWLVATWLAAMFGQPDETVGAVVGFSTLLIFPAIAGVLVRRPWLAAALAAGVVMNLFIAFTVRFGPPRGAEARAELVYLVVPVVLTFVISWGYHRIGIHFRRPKPE